MSERIKEQKSGRLESSPRCVKTWRSRAYLFSLCSVSGGEYWGWGGEEFWNAKVKIGFELFIPPYGQGLVLSYNAIFSWM